MDKHKSGNSNLAVGCIYRPPHISYNNLDCLYQPLDFCNLNSSHIVMAGDFNINFVDQGNTRTLYLSNITKSFNLSQIISHPTRIANNSSTLIDLVFVSQHELVTNVIQSPIAFSDHNLITFSFSIPLTKRQSKFITNRCFSKINIVLFSTDASAADWDSIFGCNSIDDMVEMFNKIVVSLFDKHAPLKTRKVKHLPAPWLTDNIKSEFKKRDVCLKNVNVFKIELQMMLML